jgi:nicotinamidase-related amidase
MANRVEDAHIASVSARRVLVLVDVIHDFVCEDGPLLHERTRRIAPEIARLRRAARAAKVPVIYVNDNHGRWRSSWEDTVVRAVNARRGDVARRLRPAATDWFVLKPARSAFYQTPLEALLDSFGAREIIIAGVTTDMCVFSTAHDAVLRHLRCYVPGDTTIALDDESHERALALLAGSLRVDTRPWHELAFLRRPGSRAPRR